ncbi:hypothetical protein RIF29_21658 [Crotalaria pallida]|uniref:Uncharacterized protein n=1 Tax=Crotalaria pallida TaxID=3830 RepID=A0AAN9F3C0_CROPI
MSIELLLLHSVLHHQSFPQVADLLLSRFLSSVLLIRWSCLARIYRICVSLFCNVWLGIFVSDQYPFPLHHLIQMDLESKLLFVGLQGIWLLN